MCFMISKSSIICKNRIASSSVSISSILCIHHQVASALIKQFGGISSLLVKNGIAFSMAS